MTKRKQGKKKGPVVDGHDDSGASKMGLIAGQIVEVKRSKTKSKMQYTRAKNQLLSMLVSDAFDQHAVEDMRKKFTDAFNAVTDLLLQLGDLFDEAGEVEAVDKTTDEIDVLDEDFSEVSKRVQECMDALKDEFRSRCSSRSHASSKMVRSVAESARSLLSVHQSGTSREASEQQVSQREANSKNREVESIQEARRALDTDYIHRYKDLTKQLESIQTSPAGNVHPEDSPRSGTKSVLPSNLQKITAPVDEGIRRWLLESEGASNNLHGRDGDDPDSLILTPTAARPGEIESPGDLTRRVTSAEKDKVLAGATAMELGKDMWKQLRRVGIPVFSGDKRTYQSWKAAFTTCIDQAPATAEYKLLQLRSYLKGDALKVVDSLGYSAAAYQAAKERLERKYGGLRRQVAINLEELDQFRAVRSGNAKDVEKLADLLDVVVVNLREAGRSEELGNGSLYIKVQKKMTESMLTNYHRWMFEKYKPESLESLREWLIQEAEFLTIAAETIKGLGYHVQRESGRPQTMFGDDASNGKSSSRGERNCLFCPSEIHPPWKCPRFKEMNVVERWKQAKRNQLCYRCLGRNHRGVNCPHGHWKCSIANCDESHHHLLHEEKNISDSKQAAASSTVGYFSKPVATSQKDPVKTEETLTSADGGGVSVMALRTIPVVLRNGNRKMLVNALLDDGSTKSYINEDVAAELGLEGPVESISVNTMNGRTSHFRTMPVEFVLQSVDGSSLTHMLAHTTKKVTGNMRPVEWRVNAGKWQHLRNISFPKLGPRPVIDLLIGIDYPQLHSSLEESQGECGNPVARRTPLGWTCIGQLHRSTDDALQTNFNWTYYAQSVHTDEISRQLQRFWELEAVDCGEECQLTSDEQEAKRLVQESLVFTGGRYQVRMPWKSDPQLLPDNYITAYKRLVSTEKRLLRDHALGQAYQAVISNYVTKAYITKVNSTTKEGKWYLPHFAISKPEKSTTKTRVVFDASVTQDGISLNDIIHRGPKLQRELFEILLRFRKYPVALVCDVTEMYLQIGLAPEDRPFHRFLWRDLDQSREPDVYEFSRLVFGVNSCPFQAQFVTQNHAEKHTDDLPLASEAVLDTTYMDDTMDSVETDDKGVELYQQLTSLWSSAGMHARK